MMRILNIIPSLSGGGAESQLGYLAPELVRMGHEVYIVYINDGPYKPELPGVVLYKLKASSNYDPYLLWQLFRLIHRIKPDIIHTWILQMDILGGILARLYRIPWIIREPSSNIAYTWTLKHHLRVLIGSGASAIVSNSLGGDKYWETKLPTSCRYVIANGLPLPEIDSTLPYLPINLEKSNAPIVLYVGRMIKSKNLKTLLEVFATLKNKTKIVGILCGDGPQRTELEVLRHNLNLDLNVHITGYLPPTHIWALMKQASVFVSLSKYEGCPNTIMEAMACGCPLVISDISAHREILDDDCALFTDKSNIKQIASTIMKVFQNENASRVRSAIARQKAQVWSISEMSKKYEIIYKQHL